jgi:hypothetical protein
MGDTSRIKFWLLPHPKPLILGIPLTLSSTMEDSSQCIRAIPFGAYVTHSPLMPIWRSPRIKTPQFHPNNNYTTIIINILTPRKKFISCYKLCLLACIHIHLSICGQWVTMLSFEPQTTTTCNE